MVKNCFMAALVAALSFASSAGAQWNVEVLRSVASNTPFVGALAEDGGLVYSGPDGEDSFETVYLAPGDRVFWRQRSSAAANSLGISFDSVAFVRQGELFFANRHGGGSVTSAGRCTVRRQCGVTPRVALSETGRLVFSAYDREGELFVTLLSNGYAISPYLNLSRITDTFLTVWDVAISNSGSLLLDADYTSGGYGEVYGGFGLTRPGQSKEKLYTFATGHGTAWAGNERVRAIDFGASSEPLVLFEDRYFYQGGVYTGPTPPKTFSPSLRGLSGTLILPLEVTEGDSMRANDNGQAAIVSKLDSGWRGLMVADTTLWRPSPEQVVGIGHIAGCQEKVQALKVLDYSDAGEMLVAATVKAAFYPTRQELWRVTRTSRSYLGGFAYDNCTSVFRYPPRF